MTKKTRTKRKAAEKPKYAEREFDTEGWSDTVTRKSLIEQIENSQHGEDSMDLTDPKNIPGWFELYFHLLKKGPKKTHFEQVMTLAGAFEKKTRRKRKSVEARPTASFREIMDLPDWTPFKGGVFMGMEKKFRGKRKHFTIYIDATGYRALEKPQFVPPDTQPRLGFEMTDPVEWDEVFDNLVKTYKEYIWFAEEQYYYILAACAMSTFFREVFDTYPYCDFYAAELNCGKTTAMKALIWSSFQGFMPLDPTGPVIFRAIDSCKSAIGIDEVDNLLKDPESQSRILGLLNAAYQKGLVAYRISMEEGGMPIAYDPFGLKGFTHVNAIPESISSRSIVFSLIRSPTKLPLLRTAATFDLHRDRMYLLRLVASEEVEAAYTWVSEFVELANRPKDIFVPPLTMAKLVSEEVFSRMYAWAQEYADALQTEQFDEVKRTLVEILLRYSGDIKVKLLADELSETCHDRGLTKPDKMDKPYYFHTRTVLRMLSSMGIHKTDKRTDGNVHVRIQADRVQHWAVAYKLRDREEVQKEAVSIFSDLVPKKERQLITKNGEVPSIIGTESDDTPAVKTHSAPNEDNNGESDRVYSETSLSSFSSEQPSKQTKTVDAENLTKKDEESRKIETISLDIQSEDNEVSDISLDSHSEVNEENDDLKYTIGLSLDGFAEVPRLPVEGQIPDILKRLVKLWSRKPTQYKDGVKPEDPKDTELLLKGLESGYVREAMPSKFWYFTDIAKEEIDRWGL